jgi:hypothetical protein
MNIRIFSAHIQGIFNTESDKLSRLALSGDYSLKESIAYGFQVPQSVSSIGPICIKSEPLVHELLFPEKEHDNPRLQRECNAPSVDEEPGFPVISSHPLNTKVTPEIRERRKRGRDDSSRLEGLNLDSDHKTIEREKSSSWERGRYIRKRLINEEKGPMFTSWKHGNVSLEEQAYNNADCVRLLLERDWILEDPHNDKDSTNIILSSFERTTLKTYKSGWSVFVDFLL